MTTHLLRTLLVAGIGLAWSSTLPAAEAPSGEAGKFKFSTCMGCHGVPGYTNVYPTYHVPRLGGQHPQYVIAALSAYKTGQRSHETMKANASNLSEQDMADIAAFLASFDESDPPAPVRGNPKAGQKKAEACAACHGPDGNSTDPNFPRLAGQYEDYLAKALHDYKSGARKNPIMAGMAAPLSEQDIADLAAFFASRPKGLAGVR
ncbi:MAG TPA: c-type cytochrome [Candidatus Competibacteraceae bacterium]|nr:c-type cytochrome [Candidatus Competibacteraceae bacterium]